jgi:hypothetical protein
VTSEGRSKVMVKKRNKWGKKCACHLNMEGVRSSAYLVLQIVTVPPNLATAPQSVRRFSYIRFLRSLCDAEKIKSVQSTIFIILVQGI